MSGSDQKEGVGVGADEVESDEEELDEVESDEVRLDEVESDGVGSDKVESDTTSCCSDGCSTNGWMDGWDWDCIWVGEVKTILHC